jgi:hypothetical protein
MRSPYLSSLTTRGNIFSQVLSRCIDRDELTEPQAIVIVERVLFHNANKVYRLGL